MSRWAHGADRIRELLDAGRLERVAPSEVHAETLLGDASRHLASAAQLAGSDPKAAYAVMYDGVRKALAAVLARQGLRATSAGGHVAVSDAVGAQMGRTKVVIRSFGRMRRRRHEAEYPSLDTPEVDELEVADTLPEAKEIVDAAAKMVTVVGEWDD